MTPAPLAEATGLALLHLIWQGALIAGILATTLAIMRRSTANSRYLVSCAALIVLLAAGITTAVRSYDPEETPVKSVAVTPARTTAPSTSLLAAEWHAPGLEKPISISVPRLTLAQALSLVRPYTPYIVLFWLAGVLVFTLRLLVSWRRTTALVAPSTTAGERELQRLVNHLADRLQIARAVRILQSAAVEVPSVVGWLRPVILIPISSLTGLTPDQLEMVLAHELAHIRRNDFLVNALQSVAETLLFYHPAAWWISQQIRIERENCCDDLAVAVCGDPIRYARALTQLEQLRSVPMPAVAANGGSLFARVRRLVGGRSTDRDTRGWPAAAAVVAFAMILAASAIPLLARARTQTPPPAPRAPRAERPAASRVRVTPLPELDTDPDIDTDVPTPAPTPAPAVAPAPGVSAVAPTPIASVMPPGAVVDADDEDEVEEEEDKPQATSDGKLTIDELIALRVHGVTPEYIDEMRRAFGPSLSLKSIADFRAQGVTSSYVQQMRSIFGNDISARSVVSLKVMGVSPEFVTEMRKEFGEGLSAKDATGLKAMGVTPEYLREIRAAGVEVKSAHDATSLRAMGVTPEFVKSLADAGYTRLNAHDLVRLASSGIDADFIRKMSKYKTK